jgi:hypothetical protein
MFAAALKIKSDLLLNIEDYEPIMYPPGTFDEKTTDRCDGIQGNTAHGRRIALCVEAAIFVCKRAEIDDGCAISDAIITNNLCGRGKRSPRPIVKAVVVVLEESELVVID